ncbi:hypothetical protein M9458_006796, partial [Cirrhinus mrigala]
LSLLISWSTATQGPLLRNSPMTCCAASMTETVWPLTQSQASLTASEGCQSQLFRHMRSRPF